MPYFANLIRAAVGLLAVAGSATAFAAGTTAGTPVDNAVTLDYDINGGAQTPVNATTQFLVDRKLSVDLTNDDGSPISVTIGQTPSPGGVPVSQYTVTNTSNAVIGLEIAVVQTAGAMTSAGLELYLDDGGGTFDGADTLIAVHGNHWDIPSVDLTIDVPQIIFLAADDPAGTGADTADYALIAAVADGAAAPLTHIAGDTSDFPAPGGVATNDVDDPATEQDAFAEPTADIRWWDFTADVDAGAPANADVNGQMSVASQFVIATANVLMAKVVEVLYDPIVGNKYAANGDPSTGPFAANPKAIPGALLMYAIGFRNEDVLFDVDDLVIGDDIEAGAEPVEDIDEGNQTGFVGINVPGDIDIAAVNFPLPVVDDTAGDMALVHFIDCDGAPGTDAFEPDPGPEIDVDLATITCDDATAAPPGDTTVVVYFVTVL